MIPTTLTTDRLRLRPWLDADLDHPRLPEGHPLRRHVLYRLRAPARPTDP
jgi:hypothetical protein